MPQTKAGWPVVRFAITSELATRNLAFAENQTSIDVPLSADYFQLPSDMLESHMPIVANFSMEGGFVVFSLPAHFTATPNQYALPRQILHHALFANNCASGPTWAMMLDNEHYKLALTRSTPAQNANNVWIRECLDLVINPFVDMVRVWSHLHE